MVTQTPTLTTTQAQYAQALKDGIVLDEKPTFDEGLDSLIKHVEDTARGTNGNKRAIQNTIESLSRADDRMRLLFGTDNNTSGNLATKASGQESQTRLTLIDESIAPALPDELAKQLEQDVSKICPEKDLYIKYSKQISPEGYEDYHDTCFFFMLSTVAARRIVIPMSSPIHTQLYCLLAGRPAMYKKTSTAKVARNVLKRADLDWMLGLTRMTPQKLLLDMSGPIPENYKEMTPEDREAFKMRLALAGQRGWIYNEFGKLMKAMHRASGPMTDFIEVLLQLADEEDEIPSGTVGRGNEKIDKPYLAMLGTLTPASIRLIAGAGAEIWNDGFLSRYVVSCPDPNTYLDSPFTTEQVDIPPGLTESLQAWHQRLGIPQLDIEPIFDEDNIEKETGLPKETGRYTKTWLEPLTENRYALEGDAYTLWVKYRSALKALARSFHKEDFDASYERLPVMVLRVAALVASLADKEKKCKIGILHVILGIQQVEKWRASLHRMYAQINTSVEDTEPTLEELLTSYLQALGKETTAREIKQYGPPPIRKLPSKDVLQLLDGLIKVGLIQEVTREGSKTKWYRFPA